MTFPTTPILDNFNRADGPIGANWFIPSPWNSPLVSSNTCINPGTDGTQATWDTIMAGADCEVYITVITVSAADSFDLWARCSSKSFLTGDAYNLYIDPAGTWTLYRYESPASFTVLATGAISIGTGDSVGMSVVGDLVTAYFKDSGGSWAELGHATDAIITAAGYISFDLNPNVSMAVDDFGGGTISGGGPNPPVADFIGTPTSGDASLSVDFTDLSTNTPTSWAWDFGDGGTSTNNNPSYVYVTPGTYTVALTATNADGSDTETKTNYITVTTPSAPVADFNGVPVNGAAPLAVYFTDLSTNIPASWAWDFGDSGTSTDQNPVHTYTTPGVYTVALTVTNAGGSDTETKTDYITVLGIPVADFSGTPTSGTVSLSVDFTDLSTNSPTAWYWFFGDGFTDTTQNPTHVYTVVGVYTVALTASNLYGDDSETKFSYITVTDIVEVGPAEVENCDIDTGGLAVGLRVADVAIARDNNLGSLVIDASAELRVKDNAYGTLTNNGTLTSLAGDRAAWDTTAFPARHARDIDEATGLYHLVSATTQTYTVSNPSTDRSYDVTGLTLNELAAVVGTLIADLQAKGLLG